jgi:hypothetical protein
MTKKKAAKKKKVKRPKQTDVKYDDISEIVEYLVRTKRHNYTFDCWSEDDIAQEIRIICFKALDHFDVSRVKPDKWKNFFGRCVDNGLKNLKRDNYIRYSPPCKGDCGLIHADERTQANIGIVCKRWMKFKDNLKRKIRVLHPIHIDIVGDSVKDVNTNNEVDTRDLQDYLISKMPEELKVPLMKMVDGRSKEVSRKNKQKVRECVDRILN